MKKDQYEKLNCLIAEGEECKKTNLCECSLNYLKGDDFDKWIVDCGVFLESYFPNEEITKIVKRWCGALSIWEASFDNILDQLRQLIDCN